MMLLMMLLLLLLIVLLDGGLFVGGFSTGRLGFFWDVGLGGGAGLPATAVGSSIAL